MEDQNNSPWNTDQFQRLNDKHGKDAKQLSPDEIAEIKKKLATPDTRPMMDIDGSYEAWLMRISLWGKIKVTHKNPDNFIDAVIGLEYFLEYISDEERNKAYGEWNITGPEIDKILFQREFESLEGKKVTEEIKVEIDLRPDLKEKYKAVKIIINK